MRRPGVSIIASTIFAGVALGLAALGGNINSPAQMITSPNRFQPGAATHETRADSQNALRFPNASEISAGIEAVSSAPSTRSSIMAIWQSVRGAKGYLLDVSTTSLFSSYVEGYHDVDVGNVIGRVVTGLNPGTTYYYRVHPYTATGPGSYSEAMMATTVPATGLIINATFDSSITGNPNAAAIEAMINRGISIYESLFSDPFTIQIRFRYATTAPNGTPLPAGTVSRSDLAVYTISWNTFINALRADGTTSNDNLANASLPGSALSANIKPSSANGRAVGLDTPTAMFTNGTIGNGGPYDGIVTLNSASPFQFTRPTSDVSFDAQRTTEHEIDEVIGLGSRLPNGSDLRPQDLFGWSSAGVRNITSSGTRYFSIDGGATNIVNFNQHPSGDFGDWLSEDCPQTNPYVQNAFACQGQYSDVAATSPEGINLDVIGYDLVSAPVANADILWQNTVTGQRLIWIMNGTTLAYGVSLPTEPTSWSIAGTGDFNRDGNADIIWQNTITGQRLIWIMNGTTLGYGVSLPTEPTDWSIAGTGDFNGDGKSDIVWQNTSTGQRVIWIMNGTTLAYGVSLPTEPTAWSIAGTGDFNGDGKSDIVWQNTSTGQRVIWIMNGTTLAYGVSLPTEPIDWSIAGTGDFNGDGKSDIVWQNTSTGQRLIWIMNGTTIQYAVNLPTEPTDWSIAGTGGMVP